jgi:hypothetical protein
MIFQNQRDHLLGGSYVAGDLGEDVHAVGLLAYHPLHTLYLPLYSLEAVSQLLLVLAFM